jgi:hypothetical protein
MKRVLMVTVDVDSDHELAEAIDKVTRAPGVTQWTADVLSPDVLRELDDLGHEITHHRRARSWTAVAWAGRPARGRRRRPL